MSKLTPAQRAEVEANIRSAPDPDLTDPDNPEWTAEDFARARPPEDFPELAALLKNRGGRPRKETPKVPVTIRLDAEIVEHFKASGDGWQSRINATLAADIKDGRA
jgi:uncharacterized protein (DUF4415 family)